MNTRQKITLAASVAVVAAIAVAVIAQAPAPVSHPTALEQCAEHARQVEKIAGKLEALKSEQRCIAKIQPREEP